MKIIYLKEDDHTTQQGERQIELKEKVIMEKKQIKDEYVVRNFRKVVENRDINIMTNKLYEFLRLQCNFSAHFDIYGFKNYYATRRAFIKFLEKLEIRTRYCDSNESFDIKKTFLKIIENNIDKIKDEYVDQQKQWRYAQYLVLKAEFEGKEKTIGER